MFLKRLKEVLRTAYRSRGCSGPEEDPLYIPYILHYYSHCANTWHDLCEHVSIECVSYDE